MADHVKVVLTEPEAHRLSDMYGVLIDLRWVVGACRKLGRLLENPRGDIMEMEAYQAAVIVRYGRCFNSGARTAFLLDAEWIEGLDADMRETHRRFDALRDKHIAHSVNDWELNTPEAQVQFAEGKPPHVVAVHVGHHYIVATSAESIENLRALTSALLARVEREYEQERERMLQLARAIPADELERRAKARSRYPGQRDVANARGRPK